jgi:hypothetical protein
MDAGLSARRRARGAEQLKEAADLPCTIKREYEPLCVPASLHGDHAISRAASVEEVVTSTSRFRYMVTTTTCEARHGTVQERVVYDSLVEVADDR